MKILYGVVGEGMGHATRSKVVIEHLRKNHEITIVASARAFEFLKKSFPDCHVIEIQGHRFIYDHGAVDRGASVKDLIKRLPEMFAKNVLQFVEMSESFAPDVVISDFDSFAYTFGIWHNIPVISIDNMQILHRCECEVEIRDSDKVDYELAKAIVKSKLPGAFHYLITTFFYPAVRKKHTTLVPPILRPQILGAQRREDDHILVYQTSDSDNALIEILRSCKEKFLVYGLKRDEDLGNVVLKNFSEQGFVDDLSSAKAVISNGGFTLMSEAVYLHKPFLDIPVGKQFEQVYNGLYLEKLGYGEVRERLSVDVINSFISKRDDYAKNLSAYQQDGNSKTLAAVDELLDLI